MSAPIGNLPSIPASGTAGDGLDKGWVLTSAAMVFAMTIGLGLMEIGSIRRKNSRIVWYKILINIVLAIWWLFIVGYAWGFGTVNGSFLGAETFYAGNDWELSTNQGINYYLAQYTNFVWRCALAVIGTTIATAIMSERITLKAVVFFNMAYNMIILPFVYAWTFGLGFLIDDIGYFDYAGSFVIFGTGAIAGLAGLLLIQPRYNRYQRYPLVLPAAPLGFSQVGATSAQLGSSAGPRNLPSSAYDRFHQEPSAPIGTYVAPADVPASTAFTVENIVRARQRQDEDVNEHFGITDFGTFCLGAIIFFIGFIHFNGGASLGLQSEYLWTFAELAAVNTILAASGAGITTLLFVALFAKKRPVRENAATVARAIVAGMVCVAAGANNYLPWAGLVVGMLGALAYVIAANVFYRAQVDDPAEFFPVFGAAGFAGIFCAAFFNRFNGVFYGNATEGEIVIDQMLSALIIASWTFFIALICFWILKKFRALRVSIKCEVVGYDYVDGSRHLDYPEHNSIFTLGKDKAV
jgi:ammonia channel protein AmtB